LVLAATVGALLVFPIGWLSDWLWRTIKPSINVGALFFYGPWLIIVAVVTAVWRKHLWVRPGSSIGGRAWDLATVLIVVGATLWLYQGMLARLLAGEGHVPALSLALLSGVFVGPLAEEWIFRGVLWRLAAPRRDHPSEVAVTVVATSVLFAIWHLPFSDHSPLVAHFLYGMTMGLLRWRFDRLWPCVLAHGCANSLFFFVN
jgi:membrane protease YdiL (CAAX protease family)